MPRQKKKTSIAASSAVAAVTAAGVLMGGAFASPDDILSDSPDAIVQTLSSASQTPADGGSSDDSPEEEESVESKRSFTGGVRRLVRSAPVGVRAVVAVPLWALGTAVIALLSSLWSAVLSPAAASVLGWLSFALLALLIFALTVKTVFPDLPLKKILNKRSVSGVLLLCFIFGALDCVLPFFWEDYQNLSKLLKLFGSLICTGVPVAFFVRRRSRRLKREAAEAEAAPPEPPREPSQAEREAATRQLVAELADSVCPRIS